MDSERVFLGVDVGSASVRAGLYDRHGRRLAFAVRPIQQFHPRAGFVEQSSADIWTADRLRPCARPCATAGIAADAVAAIGFDATCSLVAVGPDGGPVSVAEDGDPARDIIMWMDHRAGRGDRGDQRDARPGARLRRRRGQHRDGTAEGAVAAPALPGPLRARRGAFSTSPTTSSGAAAASTPASVCTLTCKWNYLAHERRFPAAMLAAVGLDDVRPSCRSRSCRWALRPAADRRRGRDPRARAGHRRRHRHHRRARRRPRAGRQPARGQPGADRRHVELPHGRERRADHGARGLGSVLRRDAAGHLAQRGRPERRRRAARLDAAPERGLAAGAGDRGARAAQRLRGAERLGRRSARRASRSRPATCTCCPTTTATARPGPNPRARGAVIGADARRRAPTRWRGSTSPPCRRSPTARGTSSTA